MNLAKTYLFFGNVGAGKGTQIAYLKEFLAKDGQEVVYAYPGEYFRSFTKEEGYSNALGKEILDRGNLLPLFLVAYATTAPIVRDLKSESDHIIFDGFPRSLEQVPVFSSIIKFYKRDNAEIVCIKISKEEAKRRLLARGRHDDTESGIDRRFEEYENNVVPALELLKSQGFKVHTINGEQTIEEVKVEMFEKLGL